MNWPIIMGVPGSVGALVGLWILLGFPTFATSSDIRRLDRHQAEVAVEVFDNKLRRYLAQQPPADPAARQNWDEEVRRAKGQLDAAEQRRIELGK